MASTIPDVVVSDEISREIEVHTLSGRVVSFKLPKYHYSQSPYFNSSAATSPDDFIREFERRLGFSANRGRGRSKKCINRDYLRSAEGLIKIMEVCLCILSILLCVGVSGVSGEKGFAIACASLGLVSSIAISLVKYRSLNLNSTPQHWFIMESLIYATLAVALSIASFMMVLVNAHYWMADDASRVNISLFASASLAASTSLFIADIVLVWRERHSRTWIPFISRYRI